MNKQEALDLVCELAEEYAGEYGYAGEWGRTLYHDVQMAVEILRS